MSPLVLDEAQTRAALSPPALMAALRTALRAISDGTASAPPRIAARTPAGLLGAMPGYVPGLGLAAKLVSVFGSRHRGVVAYFDEQDGELLALLDAEPITALRTAATATLSMQVLAPEPAKIAVIGTGVQAAAQLDLLRTLDVPIVVAGRDRTRAEGLATRHPRATAARPEAAVRGADVVFCCTSSRSPVLDRSWLGATAHVSSVGGSEGPELDAATIAEASLFAEWPGAVLPPPAGAHEFQGATGITLLGATLSQTYRPPPGLTVFKSTGHAALDVAAAAVAYRAARP